jgi:hypothetical protein
MFIRALAESNRRALSNQIIHMLKDAQRQAELPGRRQHGGMSLADAITERMAKVEALPDAPDWDGEDHA